MHPSSPDRLADLVPSAADLPARVPLIVLSHLRWGFVFQRPQHLLTRLAGEFDVWFVEEPVFVEGESRLHRTGRFGQVHVVTPHTNVREPGFNDDQIAAIKPLIADLVAEQGLSQPLVWLYTPMALPLVADLEPRAVIYDCMDDLASFKFAPPQLVAREAALMALADLVTTGGPSLHEARKGRHPNIHCLPSAVDSAHFAACNLDGDAPEGLPAAELHRSMAHPRLGFFGVIDERLDLELLVGLADRRPDWQIVMVGPVVKIDAATLPRRPNIHWVGMQTYEALPHHLSHWDVCLLPFALNEATRFISPTKTLEYLAGGKPVVSTPIHDVLSLYGSVVRVGADADQFVECVEQALAESAADRADWRIRAQAVVDASTWDGTAALIAGLLRAYAPLPGIVLEHASPGQPSRAQRPLERPASHASVPTLTEIVAQPATL